MVLICRGEFAEAETMAHRAYELGVPPKTPSFTAHLVIGWYQGRDAELSA
jgi:hypothetical protein